MAGEYTVADGYPSPMSTIASQDPPAGADPVGTLVPERLAALPAGQVPAGRRPARGLQALAAGAGRTTRALAEAGMSLLLPRRCPLCTLPAGSQRSGLCTGCDLALAGRRTLRCRRCGLAVDAGQPCTACTAAPPPYDATVVLGDYAPPLDHAITALKYRRALGLAAPLGAALAAPVREAGIADWPERLGGRLLLTAVPPAPLRLADRGFDQAWELARALARHAGLPAPSRLLERRRETLPQESLLPGERRDNLSGAFAPRRPLAAAVVLVVDDVMTTGATLAAVAIALRAGGAAAVVNLVLARTPPGRGAG